MASATWNFAKFEVLTEEGIISRQRQAGHLGGRISCDKRACRPESSQRRRVSILKVICKNTTTS